MEPSMSMNDVLSQMRNLRSQMEMQAKPKIGNENIGGEGMGGLGGISDISNTGKEVHFSSFLTKALDHVNEIQQDSKQLKTGFQQGDPDISLSRVMIASQKSSVAFQAAVQVRNKMIESYKDIMNMPL